ncbi:hypothetical protein KC921_02315 [Candidatus Woesebacteria bacterium]|nr:hypothetical protein [Candidatus Woesebacteria bacterium]
MTGTNPEATLDRRKDEEFMIVNGVKVFGIIEDALKRGWQVADLALAKKIGGLGVVPQAELASLETVLAWIRKNDITGVIPHIYQEEAQYVLEYIGGYVFVDRNTGVFSMLVLPDLVGVTGAVAMLHSVGVYGEALPSENKGEQIQTSVGGWLLDGSPIPSIGGFGW